MYYFCCEHHRHDAIRNSAINGIDFVEVLDDPGLASEQRQRTLFVYFVNDVGALTLTSDNFRVEGGERIRHIKVDTVNPATESNVLELVVDRAGDFSIYSLHLVVDQENAYPPDGIDPMLAAVDFSFKVECPSDFDCESTRVCPPVPVTAPPINYLAKDYGSFRRLMLDRIALLAPQWQEHHAADMGMMLVELLAHVGDHLSYQQDAIATEAYLQTARKRVSVKRHARLVDYRMHDGCNARTWVQVQVDADNINLPRSMALGDETFVTKFFTAIPRSDYPVAISPTSKEYQEMLRQKPSVFESMHDKILFLDHNHIDFYTWSDEVCCLPRGATRATLKKNLVNLQEGDVLVFEEVIGAHTGEPEDADPTRRHGVRLTAVQYEDQDSLPLRDPVNNEAITEIQWSQDDALPFAFTLSSHDHSNVSVARGNIILCDHGITSNETLAEAVPNIGLDYAPDTNKDPCDQGMQAPIMPRYRARLTQYPLTHAASVNMQSATAAVQWSMQEVKPVIALEEVERERVWYAQTDLLQSQAFDSHFVVEVESDDSVSLRFGNDIHGMRPEANTRFEASYRIGNGRAGNIGADSLQHVVTTSGGINSVRNLMPARGGQNAESIEEARRYAPHAFRTQQRAVTPADYETISEGQAAIQDVAAMFRWTGSWHTVFLTVDREDGKDVDAEFESNTRAYVEPYRMAGHDLEVDGPRYVPLEIDMQVCVKPEYFRSDVKRTLLDIFSARDLPDATRGIFHADNLSFGQTVYLSSLYSAAQAVAGVDSVHITRFQRQFQPDDTGLREGRLTMDRLEVPRLDNDANFAERGVFRLSLGGGK